MGPATAYAGTQCISTGLDGDYSNNDSYALNTATSPVIDLTGSVDPVLSFYMWLATEGCYDGFNMEISTDMGTSWTSVGNTMPQYNCTTGGEPAWGGQEGGDGWQLVTSDLSTYVPQGKILLRFEFYSDGNGVYAGAFIDAVLVNDN
jgi:hypothetical protein